MLDNKSMKFGKNWVDDESITDEEKLAYFETLEPAVVLNVFQKIELDMKNAEDAKIALEKEINSRKLG
jgi:hypothetical protein